MSVIAVKHSLPSQKVPKESLSHLYLSGRLTRIACLHFTGHGENAGHNINAAFNNGSPLTTLNKRCEFSMSKYQLLRLMSLTMICVWGSLHADTFVANDIFGLEYANDPQIAPDGERIVYVRNSMDIMKDRGRSNLWIIDNNGNNHRAIASSSANFFSPRWSADGKRLLYASSEEGSVQIYLRWMDSGQVARLTDLTASPGSLSWSPDGIDHAQHALQLDAGSARGPQRTPVDPWHLARRR